SLVYLDDKVPQVVLDLGSGTGHATAAMRKRWPKAQVIAMDLALPMLRQARRQAGWWKPFPRVCADARAAAGRWQRRRDLLQPVPAVDRGPAGGVRRFPPRAQARWPAAVLQLRPGDPGRAARGFR